MLRTRVIPLLLLKSGGLYKTTKFRDPKYVGDPINAIRIFNEKEVDELIILDIDATIQNREPDYEQIENFSSECFMPLCYGGGLSSIEQIQRVFELGIEKVSINLSALKNPDLIEIAVSRFGAQSIIVAIDVKKDLWGAYRVYNYQKRKYEDIKLADYIEQIKSIGPGELLINNVDRDGTLSGYDFRLLKEIVGSISTPVIACGGASSISDFVQAKEIGVSGCAAGSLFVFHGKHKAVLITYPSAEVLKSALYNNLY